MCSLKHPTVLHITAKPQTSEQQPGSSVVISKQMCGRTGAGKQDCVLSIVPVQVKAKGGNKILKTYAFLDPGSDATFCTEHLMRKLNLNGNRTSIFLRTMEHENTVNTGVLTGLEIASDSGDQFYDLPDLYTQRSMPVTKNNVVTQEDIQRWPYLERIKGPDLDAEVDLLIGTDAPKLLEPWEIINSRCDNGPYAVRTLLGWVVNGPLIGGVSSSGKNGFPTVTANRISLSRLEDLLITQYNQDFNEKSSEETGMSREDLRFLQIVEESIKLKESHCCFDLPFKSDNVSFPNNRAVVEQRAMSLKRKFKQNKVYQQEYTHFLADIIKNDHAEQVPQHQLNHINGKIW